MGLEGVLLDGQYAAYVLTLGVAHPWRGVGVATRLIDLLLRSAAQRGCVAAYLHVLSENGDAQRLYTRHGFEQRGLLKDFYSIEYAGGVVVWLCVCGSVCVHVCVRIYCVWACTL